MNCSFNSQTNIQKWTQFLNQSNLWPSFSSFLSFFFFCVHFHNVVVRSDDLEYERSPRGNPILLLNYNRYVRNRESKKRIFWRCTKYYQNKVNCPGSVAISKPDDNGLSTINVTRAHNDICDQLRAQDERRARRFANTTNVIKSIGSDMGDPLII